MRFIQALLLSFVLLLVFTGNANSQFFENFDTGDKGSYAAGSVMLTTGDWFLDDALLGSLSNDKFNGSQSVRMDRRNGRMGNMYMLFDKTGGADELTFKFANYGSSSDNKLQVQYSTNQGSTWTNLGDELTASGTLEEVTLPVNVSGNILFKFIHSGGGDRLNVDDVSISDFIVAADDPTIAVTVDDISANSEDAIDFGSTLEGSKVSKTIEIKNTGNPNLVITSITTSGQGFSQTMEYDDTLAFNEKTSVTVDFEPTGEGDFQGSFSITSNAVNASPFNFSFIGEGFADGALIPIADARKLPLGTRVTVAGRVTVGNEFGGPLYMQDGTAGIAVFWEALHTVAKVGDSVQVSGPLTVFKPIAGADEDFLLQISDTETDNNIVFEILDVPVKEPIPQVVNLLQLNSKDIEGQLVAVQNVDIDHTGAFQANTNYGISDGIGTAELRVDNNTNLVGAIAPDSPTNVIGVVGQFNGVFQLLPRTTEDVGVEAVTFPGDDISKELTLEVVTWNVEWFGNSGNGPEDENLQLQNVKTVIETIDADIYALQEISSPTAFNQLVSELDGYGGFLANFSQTQETAYLFRRASIDSLESATLSSGDGFTQQNWANGRYPLYFKFLTNINGKQNEIHIFNIHAKAFGDLESYNQRLTASAELKSYLDNNFDDKNVIMLGDYNDEIISSTFNGNDSPYKNFVDDPEYTIITKSLEEKGFESQSSGSFLDHIAFSSELSTKYFTGTERVENPFYIGSYLSTTSDHFPVWVRFDFGPGVSNEEENTLPEIVELNQNYPNPFNPATVISYTLNHTANVSLSVFDITGRKVATLVDGVEAAGEKQVSFNAASLSSGIYFYQLKTSNGVTLTRKMMLIK